jgi:hypothetical protein
VTTVTGSTRPPRSPPLGVVTYQQPSTPGFDPFRDGAASQPPGHWPLSEPQSHLQATTKLPIRS